MVIVCEPNDQVCLHGQPEVVQRPVELLLPTSAPARVISVVNVARVEVTITERQKTPCVSPV